MGTFAIAFWGITATLNFLVGNVAMGTMASSILVYQITRDDSDEEETED